MRIVLVCLLAFLSCDSVAAQAWPTKPVKIIVSQAAGSAVDITCRLIADRLSQVLGQQMVIENRPGNSTIIGAQAAARSEPDGYTFLFATAATLVTNRYTYKSLPYDPARDFRPVSMVLKGPFMILANRDLPVKSLADLVAYEKGNSGKLSIGIDGLRFFSGFLALWLNKVAGTNFLPVPYSNLSLGKQDVIAGRVPLVILSIPAAAPLIASGALRPLAVSSTTPMPKYENVPPIAQTFPGLEVMGWFIFVAPTGTPTPIVERMNRELNTAFRDSKIISRLLEFGLYVGGDDTLQETESFLRAQRETWSKVLPEIGVQPE